MGWAILDEDNKDFDLGVRIFPAGLDAFNSTKEKSLCAERREKRGARRTIRRKSKRKKELFQFLQKIKLAPENKKEREAFMKQNPYDLRAKALKEKLTLYEIGRIFIHLNSRRGFLSLKKSEESGGDKGKMLGEISELEKEMGEKTFGEYLHSLKSKDENSGERFPNINLRKRHFKREMIFEEFEKIWKEQAVHHPKILTDESRYGTQGKLEKPWKTRETRKQKKEGKLSLGELFGIEGILFFQHKVYWKAGTIGNCRFEKGKKRCPISCLEFQKFRSLSQINNLRIIDENHPERKLEPKERAIAIELAEKTATVKFEALRKEYEKKGFCEKGAYTFNLEAGERKSFNGNATNEKLKKGEAYGKEWMKLDWGTRAEITKILVKNLEDEGKQVKLEKIEDENFDKGKIEDLLSVNLPAGYGNLSLEALDKINPHLERGMIYQGKDEEDSAIHRAGYEREDEKSEDLKDLLLNPEDFLKDRGVTSPVVKRSVHELKKVVNALIKKYGRPQKIHIEMAREVKRGKRQRVEDGKKTRGFEEEREEAKEGLEKNGISPSRTGIEMYRLWKEQGRCSPYSLKTICWSHFENSELEIDHIIPRSRGGGNGFNNKILCFKEENQSKDNRTPYEYLWETENWEALCENIKNTTPYKYQRFIAQEVPKEWKASNLNDTAHAAKVAREYLSQIVPDSSRNLFCTKGTPTAILRGQWQLNKILQREEKRRKNREDHRHHSLDALIIAATTPKILQKISDLSFEELSLIEEDGKKVFKKKYKGGEISPPWGNSKSFRRKVEEKIDKIWVSHRVKRKTSGSFHKETAYSPKLTEEGNAVSRKEVKGLSKTEKGQIIDKKIGEIVRKYLEEKDEHKKKKGEGEFPEFPKMKSGVPIKRVRIERKENTRLVKKQRFAKDSIHHLALFQAKEGKDFFEKRYVLDIQGKKENPISREPQGKEGKFFMSLSLNESFLRPQENSRPQLWIYKTADKNSVFSHKHFDVAKKIKGISATSLLKEHSQKVTVTPLGEIRRAGD